LSKKKPAVLSDDGLLMATDFV